MASCTCGWNGPESRLRPTIIRTRKGTEKGKACPQCHAILFRVKRTGRR